MRVQAPSRTVSTSAAPAASIAAMTNSATEKLCVASVIAPSMYGPTKPPVFPTELTSAIDAAAPTPPIVDVVSAQKGPNIDARPSMAIDSVTTDQAMPVDAALSTSP